MDKACPHCGGRPSPQLLDAPVMLCIDCHQASSEEDWMDVEFD